MDSTVASSTTTTARQRRPFSSTSTHQHASSGVPSHQDHTTTSNTTTAPTTPPTSSSTTSSSRLTASLTLSLPPSKSPFYYPLRLLTLFTLGFLFSIIIDHLQQEHNITRYPVTVNKWFSTASWVPLCCGFSGCLVGTVYPWMDLVVGERPGRVRREWSSVIRYVFHVGMNAALK
ncbi:insulin-induced protein-domain-containing protein [Chytridium lagenaria]|nr:insulin-induced protein-domain-containing protein [Chytridium lagenaria]